MLHNVLPYGKAEDAMPLLKFLFVLSSLWKEWEAHSSWQKEGRIWCEKAVKEG